MKPLYQSLILAFGALTTAGVAFSQVPSTNDTSDVNGNTGVGSSALGGPAASNAGSLNIAVGYLALGSNTTGSYNSASGAEALQFNTTGSYNTAVGFLALNQNTTGNLNVAIGVNAMTSNTTGNGNTATGVAALRLNTTGFFNTAVGNYALDFNTTGVQNTASGFAALYSNTTGGSNTAVGMYALELNTTGNNNTASGYQAMFSNTSGANNTAFGYNALYYNEGGGNAAQGYLALYSNTTGNRNLALGNDALGRNSTGSYNIGLGFQGGLNLTTGTDNIDIANVGVAGESQTLRLGTQGTPGTEGSGIIHAYIAGVTTSQVTGSAVYITASGQLGVLASSERYKTEVRTMGSASERLEDLRPVTFKLKSDATGTRQYGLIAEEVAKVYPELVIRDADGQINGVRYEELTPMLLNEVQRQEKEIVDQGREIAELKAQLTKVMAVIEQRPALVAANR